MRPLAETILPYRQLDEHPVSAPLLAAGAAPVTLIDEGAMDRAGVDGEFNRDNCHPPRAAALDRIAAILRSPARNGMGRGPVHAIVLLETVEPLRQHVDAAMYLRTRLAKAAEVSIGMFPGVYSPSDEAWADAAKVVTAPVGGLYAHNEVIRRGLDYWLGEIRARTAQFRAWFPRRRRKIALICPALQVHHQAEPENADILDQHDKPMRLDWWYAGLEELKRSDWQPLPWWRGDAKVMVAHMDAVCAVYGLMREVPAVVA